MPYLNRDWGAAYYRDCDEAVPWQRDDQGACESVLFLNGLAIDGDIWVTWLPELVGRFRLIRLDLRGFGRSDTLVFSAEEFASVEEVLAYAQDSRSGVEFDFGDDSVFVQTRLGVEDLNIEIA